MSHRIPRSPPNTEKDEESEKKEHQSAEDNANYRANRSRRATGRSNRNASFHGLDKRGGIDIGVCEDAACRIGTQKG